MGKCFLSLAGVSGFIAVALGAFGAHALKDKLDAYHLGVFKTGVDYHFIHTLAIAVVGLLLLRTELPVLKVSAWAFSIGILIFSGSLYLLALTGHRWLGAITPIGGVSFLIGWACFAFACYRMN